MPVRFEARARGDVHLGHAAIMHGDLNSAKAEALDLFVHDRDPGRFRI